MKYFFIFIILLLLVSCKKENISSPSEDNVNDNYPTTINKPDVGTNFEINYYDPVLETYIRANVDSFGFIGHLVGLLQRGNSSITNQSQAIGLAKIALLSLSDRTCVFDTSLIEVQYATNHNSSPLPISDWQIYFESQKCNGLEVWKSNIFVLVSDDLIQIDGHWYKDIFVPSQGLISKEQAKEILAGTEIESWCWYYHTFIVADSTINIDLMTQCIYPLMKSDSIELRVVWKIPINYTGYYFIDALTGEKIAYIETSEC